MIQRFLRRKTALVPPAEPAVPEGVVIWAVGDIHGRLDLLEALLEGMLADASSRAASSTTVIFLGDYVDRGDRSRGVIELLAGLRDAHPHIEWRFLKGNHEETMIRFLSEPEIGQQWCEYGGEATLASYGLAPPPMRHRAEAWAGVSADLGHRLSPRERAFLESLELSVTIGDYFFVHAGARPGQPLHRQTEHDLIWIRRTFTESPVGFERVVVHGHTPENKVHADGRRIGLDTRAYSSGVLSAVRLQGRSRELLQTMCLEDPAASGQASQTVLKRTPLQSETP